MDDDDPKLNLEYFFDEATERHLENAIKWSGKELVSTPALAEKITTLLKGNKELTNIVLGISVTSRVSPPIVFNDITTGFVMGVALVLECLNDREEFPGVNYNDTIQ
jgi:hypothetical protein